MLALGGGKVDVTGPAGGIAGDLCVGPNGKLSITGSQFVTGSIRLATGATLSKSGPGSIRAVLRNTDLMPEISDAISAARRDGALPCTQTFASLDTSRVIAGAGGTNVICVGDLTLNGGEVVALRGGASDTFVVNVTGRFALTGGSRLVASGVAPSAILYDVIGDGPQVQLSGGGGGERCCRASVDGTVIALGRDIALAPARVNGEVIGGRNISIVGGASVGCQACP